MRFVLLSCTGDVVDQLVAADQISERGGASRCFEPEIRDALRDLVSDGRVVRIRLSVDDHHPVGIARLTRLTSAQRTGYDDRAVRVVELLQTFAQLAKQLFRPRSGMGNCEPRFSRTCRKLLDPTGFHQRQQCRRVGPANTELTANEVMRARGGEDLTMLNAFEFHCA